MSAYMVSTAPNHFFEDPQKAALQYGSKALYQEFRIDKAAERLEKKILPKKLREIGPYVIIVGRLVFEKKFSYVWTF